MFLKKWNYVVGTFAVAGLLAFTLATQPAWAQATSGSGDGLTSTQQPRGDGGPGRSGRGGHGPEDGMRGVIDPAAIKSAVAGALGITTEELEAAHQAGTTIAELAAAKGVAMADLTAAAKAAAITEVNDAVAAGTITQAQADALIERINSSDFPLGPRGDGGPGRSGRGGHGPEDGMRGIIDPAAIKSAVAGALGMTTEELDAAHQAGTTLAELAAAKGVAMADLTAAAKAAAITEVNDALAAGTITQAQADALIERINSSDFPLGPRDHHGNPDNGNTDNGNTDDGSTTEDTVNGNASTSGSAGDNRAVIFIPVVAH